MASPLPPSFHALCAEKSVLILDSLPEMRSFMRSQITHFGCRRVVMSGTVREALEQLKTAPVDIIISDYHLTGETTGQQLLEYLRTRNIIGRGVIFLMVTAEHSFESVVTAAEHLPDAYLLKPFTTETIRSRLEALLRKKQRLAKIDQLQDKRNWDGVIQACDQLIELRDSFLTDALRIKGHALLSAGRVEVAVAFYREMLAQRSAPWAQLGLARALGMQGHTAAAEELLNQLLEESPKFMAAYDVLSQIQLAAGMAESALATLDRARAISPNSLSRHRVVASVAERMGDWQRAEESLDKVVKSTRNTMLRHTDDFARLGNVLSETGKLDQAIALLDDAQSVFRQDAASPMLASVEAIVHQKAGNPERAAAALNTVLQTGDPTTLPVETLMMVAKACLTTGKKEAAAEYLKVIVQNQPEAKDLHEQVSSLLHQHGEAALVEHVVTGSVQELMKLNNEAVQLAKGGQFSKASAMLVEAAERLPGNTLVASNASIALLNDVLQNGVDPAKLRLAQKFQQSVLERSPGSPKLGEIHRLLQRVREKFASPAKA